MTAKTLTKIVLADLLKRIDGLNSTAAKLMEEYQEVGLLCLQHLKESGDVGPCNRLQLGMPKGARKLAMGVWLMKHGSLQVNTDKGTKDTMPMRFLKGKETNLETAAAKKWYDEVPERELSDVFDLQVAIKRMIAQATKAGVKLKIGGEDKPHEAHQLVKMLAVGVGLPNPFAADEAAAAEAIAKAAGAAKDGEKGGPVNPGPAVTANADKPTARRETAAQAAARPEAAKKQSGKNRATPAKGRKEHA